MDLQKIIAQAEKAASRPLSKRTLSDYRSAVKFLDELTPQQYREYAIQVEKKPISPSRYRNLKCGYQRGCAERVSIHVRFAKTLHEQGQHKAASLHDAEVVKWAKAFAAQKPDYDRQRYKKQLGAAHPKPKAPKVKSQSKKQHIAAVNRAFPNREWQDLILTEMPEQHKNVCALLMCAGSRPIEADKNKGNDADLKPAEIRITNENKLSIKIWGAKVTKWSGQPWRELIIDPENDRFAKYLHTLALFQGGSTKIKMSCSQRAFRESHSRAVGRALGAKWVNKISLYSHRQAFSADLKKAGHSQEEVALAMGHASDRSQAYYCIARQGNAGGRGLESVEAARAVKESGQGQDVAQRIVGSRAAREAEHDQELDFEGPR